MYSSVVLMAPTTGFKSFKKIRSSLTLNYKAALIPGKSVKVHT